MGFVTIKTWEQLCKHASRRKWPIVAEILFEVRLDRKNAVFFFMKNKL